MSARLYGITAFRLTTVEPDQLAHFYGGLGFEVGTRETIPDHEIAMLGLTGGGTRLPLRLGEQRIDLDCFDPRGRPYPRGATSADLCFQHFALVTDDAMAAWERAVALGAEPISTAGPVTLPASAGGVTAVKFRDPEGHPLELLQFPPDHAHRWQGTGLLGIDHSAISVSDIAASRLFYEGLGLSQKGGTLNQGPTQENLDGLSSVRVNVVPMMPRQGTPHLELLGYRTSRAREAGWFEPNDIAATRTIWAADRNALIRDPDNHLHMLNGSRSNER